MELGALVCTPRSPLCGDCPLTKSCIARKKNLQAQLPNLGKRKAATARRFMAFVIERDGTYLVQQRPAGVVNAHLWEFPNTEVAGVGEGSGRIDGSYRLISTKPLFKIHHPVPHHARSMACRTRKSTGNSIRPLAQPRATPETGVYCRP
jgi:A/G-specific adenine glycosylase